MGLINTIKEVVRGYRIEKYFLSDNPDIRKDIFRVGVKLQVGKWVEQRHTLFKFKSPSVNIVVFGECDNKMYVESAWYTFPSCKHIFLTPAENAFLIKAYLAQRKNKKNVK